MRPEERDAASGHVGTCDGGTGVPPVMNQESHRPEAGATKASPCGGPGGADTGSAGGTGVSPVIGRQEHQPGAGAANLERLTDAAGLPPLVEPKVTRRNLRHIQCPGRTYFITWRCCDDTTLACRERTITLAAILHWHGTKWGVIGAVVMPDHVHVLAAALPKGDGFFDLSEILHSIKSFSSHAIGRLRGKRGKVWRDESFDRVVRDEKELREKYDYIRHNPVKTGLVTTPQHYSWLIDQEDHRPEAGATIGRKGGTP